MAQSSDSRNQHGMNRKAQQHQTVYGSQGGGQLPYNQQGATYSGAGYQSVGAPQQKTGKLTEAQKKERLRRKREILKRRRRNRRLLIAVLVLLLIFGGYSLIRVLNNTSGDATDAGLDPVDLEIDEEAEEREYVGPPVATISFVGDISTSADQVAAVQRSDGTFDFAKVFMDVEDLLLNSDYAVANFETTMIDDPRYGVEPYYNAPVQLAGTLRSLGFRLVSTANTYMLNNGIDGLTSTKRYLAQANLKSVGTYLSQEERDENGGAYIRELHGIRFAFLSYTKGTDSVTMPDGCEYALNTLYSDYSDYWTDLKSSQIRADIQAAKDAGAEVIIALVHWGSEYGRTVTEQQTAVKDLMLNNGVDVIVGTHSHVVNSMGFENVEMEDGTTKRCFVAYGLGDFYTDPAQESGQDSVILNLTFSRDDAGVVTISEAFYTPIYQNIVKTDGKKSFEVLDVYKNIASIYRSESVTSAEAVLYNNLLDTVSSIHAYADEELDGGPADADLRVVRQAVEAGGYSNSDIRQLKKQEAAAAKAAAEAAQEEEPQYDEEPEESPTDE